MAAVSKVSIANLALSHVHAKSTIESLTESSTEARLANLWYDVARREVLASFNWRFARKRLALAEHSDDAPEDEWSYRYQYPADCLAPRYMENQIAVDADAVPFDVELSTDGTMSIVTDLEDARLVYTRDQETVSTFSPHFVVCLSYRLAWYIAGALTAKQTLAATVDKKYQEALTLAAAHDASQRVSRAPRDASWIRER